ncbi:MAG: hypothetical protein NVS1B4_15120 [Gemmatimonadaceae bacterium]
MVTFAALLGLGIAALVSAQPTPTPGNAPRDGAGVDPSALWGTWRVIRHDTRDSRGRVLSTDGGVRGGYVTFDPTGHFTQLTMDYRRRVPAYRGRLTSDDARDALESFGASFGTYTADRGDTLAYRHEGALYPGNRPGSVVLRRYRIVGDTLITDPLGEEAGRPMFTRVHVRVWSARAADASRHKIASRDGAPGCEVGAEALMLAALETERAAVLRRGDAAALDTLLDSTFVERSASGDLRTKRDNIAAGRTGALRFSDVEITNVSASVCGESGMVTGRMRRSGTLNGRRFDATIRYTRLFARRAGRWRAVFQFGVPEAPSY